MTNAAMGALLQSTSGGPADVEAAADAAAHCEAWSRYRQAADMLADSAPLLNDRGHLSKNPLHQVVRDNADHIRLLARELGLSPTGGG